MDRKTTLRLVGIGLVIAIGAIANGHHEYRKLKANPHHLQESCIADGRRISTSPKDKVTIDKYAIVVTFPNPDFDTESLTTKEGVRRFPREYWGIPLDFSISQLGNNRCYPVAPSITEGTDLEEDFEPYQVAVFKAFIKNRRAEYAELTK